MNIQTVLENIKGAFVRLFGISTIEQVTGIQTGISSEMRAAISLWESMFTASAPWHTEDCAPCGIEKTIAGALSNPIGEEVEITAENETTETILKKLNEESSKIIEYLVSFGGALVRPVYSCGSLQYELLRLGNYIPLAYDMNNTITAALIVKQLNEGKKRFLLIEKHEYKNRNHAVQSELFEIIGGGNTNIKKVPLAACSLTAAIAEAFVWQNVDMPMMTEFRNREVNRIDGSTCPAALIQNVEHLIKDADEQYARMMWEQEAGKRRIYVPFDLLRIRQGQDGKAEKPVIDPKLSKFFVKYNGDATDGSAQIQTEAPDLRTEQQKAAFQEILKRIEQATNIGRGTLSDLDTVQQTATQYTGGKKTFYTKVDQLESELEEKYHRCAYVFAYMASAYTGIPFDGEITVTFSDSARRDPQQMKQTAQAEISAGIMDKWEYRHDFYGEDEATARANVPQQQQYNPFATV